MSKLRTSILNLLQWIGDNSGCHQMPERSFHIHGWQFPLCARCTGVTCGRILALLLCLCKKIISIPLALFLVLIMGTDWGIQEIGIKESNNTRRFLTGICGGFGLVSLYFHLLGFLFKKFKKILPTGN